VPKTGGTVDNDFRLESFALFGSFGARIALADSMKNSSPGTTKREVKLWMNFNKNTLK
jgi:hypothetical protein